MKKILIVSTVSRQFYLFEKVNIEILKDIGYEVHGAADFSDSNERLDCIDIIRHPIVIRRNPFSIKNIIAYKQLKKIMKDHAFDLVHCHSPVGGVLARLAAKSAGIKKVIYTVHGFHFFKGASPLNWLLFYPIERYLSRFTDTIITINKEDYKRARGFKKKCKVEYVPGIGVDTAAYCSSCIDRKTKRRELGLADNDVVIISVGELNANKNQEVIIKSLAAIKSENVKYLVCGLGDKEQSLKEIVIKFGLENKVIFLGFRNDISELLSISDIFVLPSYREGLSVALMEAMACGLPVVCSKIRGNTDLIKSNRGGFLVAADNVYGYIDALSRLISDKDLRKSFGTFNRNRIKQNDKQVIERRMREIYISIDEDTKSVNKKRITFLIGSMGRGGAERVISILANTYSESGWQVDILLLLNNRCEYKLREDIRLINICNENKSRILYLPIWIFKIRKYLSKTEPDKVVSFIARINVIALIAGLGLGRDIVISERNNPKRDGRTLAVEIATYILYPRAKAIIFQTLAEQNCFPPYIRKKGVLVPNPVDVQEQVLPIRKKKIVSAGRLTEAKNHRMLISAFSKLKAEHPDYCLYIYGEGPLRTILEEQITDLGLTDSVFLPGMVDDLHARIADAEIFALSSNYEGQSNALIEAMMMGLPCISTRYDGVTELIEDGINGLLVNIGDDEQLYRMLNILIKDKEKALCIGQQGQLSVEHMRLNNCIPIWKKSIES